LRSLKKKHAELCRLIGETRAIELLHKWYNRAILRECKRAGIPTTDKADFMANVVEILADLNTRTGLRYRSSSKDTQALIKSRFNAGFTVEDFKKVHEAKCKMWLHTDSRIFLRPSTLYRPSKFEAYLQEYTFARNDEENKKNQKKAAIETRNITAIQEEEYDPVEGGKIVSDLLKKLNKNTKMPGGTGERK